MKTLGIIPARGGSKGIPRKNIRMLAGKPLLAWTAEAALRSSLSRVILSSDDTEIIAVGREYGLEAPFIRPPELAQDDTPAIDVVVHALTALFQMEGYRPDSVMLLQPTSPLRTARHIDEALDLFSRHPEATSLVSVVKAPHNMTPESLMRINEYGYLEHLVPWGEKMNIRQQKPQYYARNGAAIYIVRTDCLLINQTLYGNRILAYEMPKSESIDIDDEFDFELCELLLRKRTLSTC